MRKKIPWRKGENMDDIKIIELFFLRSEQAVAETKTKYNSLCMKIANTILQSYEDSEECVSSSYLKLWNAIPPKNPDSLCGYLCKTVRNTALSLFKKLNRHSYDEQYDELDEIIPSDKTVEQEYDSKMLGENINNFLGTAKQKNREIFTARYYFNMSIKQIADEFNMSETAVRSRLLRTRAELREYLSERGVTV